MTQVSTPELLIAACDCGVVGTLPTHNAANSDQLLDWLASINDRVGQPVPRSGDRGALWAANLVVHPSNHRLETDLDCLARHPPPTAITSVGSPARVVGRLHDMGSQVWSDVATLRHAQVAIDSGVDGLVLLSAGAGGQTGWMNPFAFVRAVRDIFDGVVVLAGGIGDGAALWAATQLGCDLGLAGTRFIAARESGASARYRHALVEATIDDVRLSSGVTGVPSSLLASSPGLNADHDPAPGDGSGFQFDRLGRSGVDQSRDRYFSAGHTVHAVRRPGPPAAEVIEEFARGYREAQRRASSVGVSVRGTEI